PGQKRPIEIAADNKDWDCVLAFAEFPTDEADNAHYSVALTQAVAAGRLDVVTKLRASKAKINVSVDDFLPLHLAVKNADSKMITFLLREGAHPDDCIPDTKQSIREFVVNAINLDKKDEILRLFDTCLQECIAEYMAVAKQDASLAEANYEKVVAIDPNHEEAHEALIKLYETQKNVLLAAPHHEKLIECLRDKKESASLGAEECMRLAELSLKFAEILYQEPIIDSMFEMMELTKLAIELCQDCAEP